jgi:transposase
MKLFIGLDVSLAKTSFCVISEHGKIIKEAETESAPDALVRWLDDLDGSIAGIDLEAGPLLQWLHRGLAEAVSVCRRLMRMPGIGAVVALTFRAAVDDPTRFRSSKRGDPWVGLTPSRLQSGEGDVLDGITKAGDFNLRRALCQAATVMMNRGRSTWLRTWGAQLAQRRGHKIAMVAITRRIAVILHRIWVDGTTFQPDAAPNLA